MKIETLVKTPIGVTLIVVICYIVGEVYKVIFPKEEMKRLIPVVLAVFGAILGVLIYFIDNTLKNCAVSSTSSSEAITPLSSYNE